MTKPLKVRSRLARVALGAAALLISISAQAQQRNFDISSGDLKEALDAYVAVTGQQIVYKGTDIKGRVSKGAKGAMTPEQALDRLLEGTNLKLRHDSSGAVVVFLGEMNGGSVSGLQTATTNSDIERLESIVVHGKALSHLSESNRTGTRMDADPMTLPMTVTTVDKELLAQQQVMSLRDAVANVAGVSQQNSTGSFAMRGFSAGIMRNGNLNISGTNVDAPLVSISKIEVVKGPEAIIAGVTSGYGGVVNVITKTPQIEPVTEVAGTVGSRGYHEVSLDVGRALFEDKSLLTRFVASKQGAGSTKNGYDGASDEYAAPSVTWRNKRWGTEVTAQYEYQNKRTAPSLEVFTNQPSLSDDLKLPRLGDTSNGLRAKINTGSLSLNQRLGQDLELAVKYTDERRKTDSVLALSSVGDAFGFSYPEIVSIGAHSDNALRVRSAKVELKYGFETGPIDHKLLLAYDNIKSTTESGSRYLTVGTTNLDNGAKIDLIPVLGPVFGGIPSARVSGGAQGEEKGLLLMDQMFWGDWVALAGLRSIRYETVFMGTALGEMKKTLPSLGIVYRATSAISLFGNASKGFTPNFGYLGSGGSEIAPENGQQYELGVKTLLMDRKLAASFSVYSIKQKNVAVEDASLEGQLCGNTVCYISVPGVKSNGAEVEVSGEVTKHLGLRASYSFNKKKATDVVSTGIFYAKHQASLWAIYNFGDSAGDGWWVGAGLQTRSARNQGTEADVDNAGRTRFDLSAGYQAREWSVIGGVKNAADKRLYTIGSGQFRSGDAYQPREFYLTARYSYE